MSAAQTVLLVDDDSAFRKIYGGVLREAGIHVLEASDRAGVRDVLKSHRVPVLLLDLMLPPDGSVEKGLEQLAELVAEHPTAKIIVVSGAGDVRHGIRAVQSGAFDFLTKPVDVDVLLIVAKRALARVALENQVQALQTSLAGARPGATLVGTSPAFQSCVSLAERIASSDLPVLVTGENGTGKELLARYLHDKSLRAAKPFIAINCGALTESLLESALFGHVKGAFTGAIKDHRGLFQEANGGTLFLDELGDMPASLQVKLLRVLETGDLLPVGADQPKQVDVRLVSATNKDLAALQKQGAFREDLYWRIKGAELHLPPLRDRLEDVPLLSQHFLNQCAHLCPDGRAKTLSDVTVGTLQAHPWPGNLRELRHEMQRATVLSGDRRELAPEDFSFTGADRLPAPIRGTKTLQEKIEQLERQEISAALERHQNNRTHAAAQLGLSRQGLLKKLERYGLG